MSGIIFQIQSTLIVLLMFYGIRRSKNRSLHPKIMYTTIIWDVILIAQIELNRDAIAKASHAVTNPMILNIHVSLAIATVLFYGLMIYSGRKVLKNKANFTKKHRVLGVTTFCLRILTLTTSYFAVI